MTQRPSFANEHNVLQTPMALRLRSLNIKAKVQLPWMWSSHEKWHKRSAQRHPPIDDA